MILTRYLLIKTSWLTLKLFFHMTVCAFYKYYRSQQEIYQIGCWISGCFWQATLKDFFLLLLLLVDCLYWSLCQICESIHWLSSAYVIVNLIKLGSGRRGKGIGESRNNNNRMGHVKYKEFGHLSLRAKNTYWVNKYNELMCGSWWHEMFFMASLWIVR